MRTLKASSMPEVLDEGESVSFSLIDTDDQETVFQISTDALDVLLANLEFLARLALAERLNGPDGRLPFRPNPTLPPFETHGEYFLVEELGANIRNLVVKRKGRTDLQIQLNHAQFMKLQKAIATPLTRQGVKAH